jgi:hypothetical protein
VDLPVAGGDYSVADIYVPSNVELSLAADARLVTFPANTTGVCV